MSISTIHAPTVLGAIFAAAVVGLAVSAPADAATRIAYVLVPGPPIYTIESGVNAGACPDADSNARITDAYPTQWLNAVAALSNHAAVQVQITLDSRGDLLSATIANTSGNPLLDEQALIAARGSKYAPEVRNCTSFKRTYFLDITVDSTMAALPQLPGGSGRPLVK